MTMMIDPYRFAQANTGVYVPTPFLIPSIRYGAADYSSNSSDSQAVLSAHASWVETDYIVVVVSTTNVTATTPTGLELLDELQHPNNAALRVRVYGGFKGANTSWTFTFSAGGIFAVVAAVVTNIYADDPVHSIVLSSMSSASTTRDIQPPSVDIMDDDEDLDAAETGVAVVVVVGADDIGIASGNGATWVPQGPTSYGDVYAFQGATERGAAIGVYIQAEHNTRVAPPRMRLTGSVSNAVMGTLLLRKMPGVRPTLVPDFSGLDTYLAGAAVGYAWIAIKDNEVIDSNAGGFARGSDASTNPSLAFTTNTRFPVAGISKLITEIGIRKLITDGVLSMDDTVADWMSGFTLGTNVGNITIRQLLQMTSGIAASFAIDGAHPSTMMSWIQNTSTNRGEWYNYQDGNFAVLQQIMEEATGQAYADWIEANVFAPLEIEGALTAPDTTNGVLMYSDANQSGGVNPFTVPATATAGWNLIVSDLVKLARELRAPVVNTQAALQQMLEDRYRLIADYATRGEQHFHDGALSLGNSGLRCILMRGTDGYDLITAVNTLVTYSDLHSAMRNCLR